MAGRVQVPLNFRWADPELAYALEDSGARILFCDRDPGALADLVERVIRLDPDEYETLLADSTPTDFDDACRRRTRSRRALLHRRHDRCEQGRDAHAPQPDRQRLEHPGDATHDLRRPLPHHGADVPCRRIGQRAPVDLRRRDAGHHAGIRPRHDARPGRAGTDHPDARGPDDGRSECRGTTRPAPRRVEFHRLRPRRLADRDGGRPARHAGIPRHPVHPPVRRDRDVPDRQRPRRRGGAARHRPREVRRPASDGVRGRDPWTRRSSPATSANLAR